jgi:hypothetical protein
MMKKVTTMTKTTTKAQAKQAKPRKRATKARKVVKAQGSAETETLAAQRVVVFGSREVPVQRTTRQWVSNRLAEIEAIYCVISGGAKGADHVGAQVALRDKHALVMMPACWDRYGSSAGFKRNEQMAMIADRGVCLWDGKSRGTAHMIDEMRKLGKPVVIFNSITRTTYTV